MNYPTHELISRIASRLASLYEHQQERTQVAVWMLQVIMGPSWHGVVDPVTTMNSQQEHELQRWIYEHVNHKKPLQYLIGNVPFINTTIAVEPPILIPRPETEEWCARLIDMFSVCSQEKLTILDLCSGSGCIAVALARALPQAKVVAIDIVPQAVELTQKNARLNHVSVTSILSDLYDALPGDFTCDLIVSNPPYIDEEHYQNMDRMVVDWEDKRALVAPRGGLGLVERIVAGAKRFLSGSSACMRKNSLPELVIEVADYNADSALLLMIGAGFNESEVGIDLEGKKRFVMGRRPCERS